MERFLAGTIILVLVTGILSPAFAQTMITGEGVVATTSSSFFETADHDDIIFDNGGDPVDIAPPAHNIFNFVAAEDFIIDFDFEITDVHFVSVDLTPDDFETEYGYFVFTDGGGEPGDVIASGVAQNVELGDRSENTRFVSFDLEAPVQLEANTIFWLGLESLGTASAVGWVFGTEGFGSQTLQSAFGTFDNWGNFNSNHAWFLITGKLTTVVGGELLPIDSTALLIAAAQSPAAWMTSITFAIIGVGAYIFTRNPNNMRNIKVILRDYLDRF